MEEEKKNLEFTNEELIGEKYTMIKEYLKEKLHIRENDIEIDTQIVIQAASRLF